MHGYFISLKLYETARVIANPYAYAEHREKLVREKMEKMAETRIRAKKDPGVKVNKALAERILQEEAKAAAREERRKKRKAAAAARGEEEDEEMGEAGEDDEERPGASSLLTDPRFAKVFEDPDFAIDENSREYALLHPSSVAQRGKTAVEEEEEESDKESSDGLEGEDSEEGSESEESDSDDEGGMCEIRSSMLFPTYLFDSALSKFDPRRRPGQKNAKLVENIKSNRAAQRVPRVNLAPMRASSSASAADKDVTFGQRLKPSNNAKGKSRQDTADDDAMEISWVPSSSGKGSSGSGESPRPKDKKKQKGVESFGAGLERGAPEPEYDLSEAERSGRKQRRTGVRSGSKNEFRRMGP